ncbi:MAG: peptide chain release factor N(5)-glutamine methyltransferase [Pseudomonadota bacterium]
MSATIGKVQCWAQRRLADAGIDEAKLEARYLVCHALGVDVTALIVKAQEPPPLGLAAKLEPLLARRAEREPLAHIIGETEFYGLPFFCDHRALIPRPDSETVVDLALSLVLRDDPVKIADLGAGTGCLAISILSKRPEARAKAVDISPGALALAQANAARNGVVNRMGFLVSSWADLQDWDHDLIVSNPPYIASAVIDDLQPEVAKFDPRLALDGGADGLDAYREIISLGASRMRPGAWLVFEIGFDQKDAVSALLTASGYIDHVYRSDLGGNDRAIAARRPL